MSEPTPFLMPPTVASERLAFALAYLKELKPESWQHPMRTTIETAHALMAIVESEADRLRRAYQRGYEQARADCQMDAPAAPEHRAEVVAELLAQRP